MSPVRLVLGLALLAAAASAAEPEVGAMINWRPPEAANRSAAELEPVSRRRALNDQDDADDLDDQDDDETQAAGSSHNKQLLQVKTIQEKALQDKLVEMREKYTGRAFAEPAYYTLLLVYSIFILVGTLSNSLICLTVILRPRILSPRNIFIVNLAGSDLMLCVFTMPFSFIEISMKSWQMGPIPCKLLGLQATSIYVSTISITAIALDRYKVIVYPMHQETNNGARSAALLLPSIWIGAFVLSLPLFYWRGLQHMHLEGAMPAKEAELLKSLEFCIEDWPVAHGRAIYSVISMIFQYVVPISIVSVVYSKISEKLQKRLIRRQKVTQLACQQKRQLNLIRRTHAMLMSVSLIFGLSWLPLNLLNVVGDFTELFTGREQLYRVVFGVCHLIGCSSACSNPILYGFLNDNFRKELQQTYRHYATSVWRRLCSGRCCRCGRRARWLWCCCPESCLSGCAAQPPLPADPRRLSVALRHLTGGRAGSAALPATHDLSRAGSEPEAPGAAVSGPHLLAASLSADAGSSSRRLSFQTVASSRATLGKTIRLCLCLTASSACSVDSATSCHQAGAQPVERKRAANSCRASREWSSVANCNDNEPPDRRRAGRAPASLDLAHSLPIDIQRARSQQTGRRVWLRFFGSPRPAHPSPDQLGQLGALALEERTRRTSAGLAVSKAAPADQETKFEGLPLEPELSRPVGCYLSVEPRPAHIWKRGSDQSEQRSTSLIVLELADDDHRPLPAAVGTGSWRPHDQVRVGRLATHECSSSSSSYLCLNSSSCTCSNSESLPVSELAGRPAGWPNAAKVASSGSSSSSCSAMSNSSALSTNKPSADEPALGQRQPQPELAGHLSSAEPEPSRHPVGRRDQQLQAVAHPPSTDIRSHHQHQHQ